MRSDTIFSKPELLAPAGDRAALSAALNNGADAVYLGVKGMNMRHAAANFSLNQLAKIAGDIHRRGKKIYVTLNTVILPGNIKRTEQILAAAQEAEVDAVIAWDMAVLSRCRQMGIPLHISTQASAASFEAVRAYAEFGARRVVLARECTLNDIRRISRRVKEEKLPCGIEAFVHGAMCVSVSGRCFLSQQAFAKSANEGQCLQPCRREFHIRDADGETEYILGPDYILSPKDLCAIDFLDRLIRAGITAFKIEGRMRSPEYVAEVTACYRQAIDAFFDCKFDDALKTDLKTRLSAVYNRGFSPGFYFGRPGYDDWSTGLGTRREKVFAGEVTRYFKKIGVAEVCLRAASLSKGDDILVIGPRTGAETAVIGEMQNAGEFVKRAEKKDTVGVKLDFSVRPGDKVFLWRERRD
ncbi:MAG: peptidase U32 family protein [Candidatus Omnitrophota bacterium]